jgi:hypothetical protein
MLYPVLKSSSQYVTDAVLACFKKNNQLQRNPSELNAIKLFYVDALKTLIVTTINEHLKKVR